MDHYTDVMNAARVRAMADRVRPDYPDAAQLLDRMADLAQRAKRKLYRVSTWMYRTGVTLLAASPAMAVAGIWVDMRWMATGAAALVTAAVLIGLGWSFQATMGKDAS